MRIILETYRYLFRLRNETSDKYEYEFKTTHVCQSTNFLG
jgi:hypothetical protein